MPTRVVIAEDNYLLREGTAALLDGVDGVNVVESAADLDGLLAAVDTHLPDVVITDIRMPPTNTTEGLQAAAHIRSKHPDIGVIVLSQYADPRYAKDLLRDGAAGLGYLLKERVGDIAELARSLAQVAAGGAALDPMLIESLLQRRERRGESPLATLTARERDVLAEMAQGKNNAAIASSMFLTERAVEKHINSIFAKLGLRESEGVHNRVAAVLAFLDARSEP